MSNTDDWINDLERDIDQNWEKAGGSPDNLGDARLDRIERAMQDPYEEAIRWHNARIAAGTCPRCGLNDHTDPTRDKGHMCLAGVPDDNLSMWYSAGSTLDTSLSHNGYPRVMIEAEPKRSGLSCGEALVIIAVAIGLLIWMANYVP